MSTTVEEIGRSGGSGARKRTYKVWGANSEAAALAALNTYLTAEIGPFLILDYLALKSFDYDEVAVGCYTMTANWGTVGREEPPQTSSFSISFDFATLSQKVVLPVNPIRVYNSAGEVTTAADKPQLIGDAGDGQPPEGVEVFEPMLSFSETHYKPSAFVDNTYINLLRTLIGRTNAEGWRGFAVGEVLATGVSGSRRSVRDDWELQYRFSVRENQSNVTIAGIAIPLKYGWDFLWPRMGARHNETTKLQDRTVRQVCLTNPFRAAAFSGFGIGP